jgi:hypothetical protein
MSEGGDSTQLYLSIKFSDGKVVTRVTGTFVNPLSGYPTRVLWMSSEEEVASVDSSGVLVPVSEGTAKITASIGQMSAEADVTVAASKEDASEEKPAEQRNEDAGEDDGTLPILSRAPRGTNPFADRVVRFSIGAGGGRGMERMPNAVLGPPRGEETGLAPRADILSLGRGGQITIEMTDFIIADGEGPDFTVFENAFFIGGNRETPYSEPAVVSVSEDGRNFAKFDCDLASPPLFPGCAGTFPTFSNPENGIDPTDPDVSGGNQFDLADVGLETARFVRITDGGVRAIAAAPSIGFDLDAVVVINGVIAGR